MDDIMARITAIDKEAGDITADITKRRAMADASHEAQIAAFDEASEAKLQNRLSELSAADKKTTDEEMAALRLSHRTRLSALEEDFKAHHTEMAEAILSELLTKHTSS